MAFGLAVYASQGRLPDTTQDSLPGAGQALLDGVLTRKVPMKGFRLRLFLLSQALLGATDATDASSQNARLPSVPVDGIALPAHPLRGEPFSQARCVGHNVTLVGRAGC